MFLVKNFGIWYVIPLLLYIRKKMLGQMIDRYFYMMYNRCKYMSKQYTKIILPTRPQPDTIVGIFLLKAFGTNKYSGVENATIEVLSDLPKNETPNSLEQKGYLLIDVGGSRFDHHNKGTTASRLIAEDLGVDKSPALSKLLQYAERDDKYGLGTISQDSLDKAFGLSGLIASLNKSLPEDPQKVVDYAIPLLKAHYLEEKKRGDLPREFEEGLKNGSAEIIEARHKGKNTKVVTLESDNASMSGWLRSSEGGKGRCCSSEDELWVCQHSDAADEED